MNCCCPFPLFNYCRPRNPIVVPTPPTPTPVLLNNGMQVQLTGAGFTTVATGSPVLFNNIITNLSPNITYNAITGVFTVLRAGVYYIDWWVNTDSAGEETILSFHIVTSTGANIGSSTPMPVTTMQLNGNALVYLPENATFSLVNTTPAPVGYAQSTINANLTVMKVNTL